MKDIRCLAHWYSRCFPFSDVKTLNSHCVTCLLFIFPYGFEYGSTFLACSTRVLYPTEHNGLIIIGVNFQANQRTWAMRSILLIYNSKIYEVNIWKPFWGLEDDSVIKREDYFIRGPEFGCQHPHWEAHNCLNVYSVPRDLKLSLGFHGCLCSCARTHKKLYTYLHN